jgi:type IV pilus assembly protein PilA
MQDRRESGFSLIELMIVVAIIAIVAAIAVPQLFRARLASMEAAALGSLRAITTGQANFAATCAGGAYATDLADLARPMPGSSHAFISPDLGTNGVVKSGYAFALVANAAPGTTVVLAPACNGAVAPRSNSFYANGVPTIGTPLRFFATDTPGTIYQSFVGAIPNPIPGGTPTL